ncbi:MAG: cation:proton antiporter [Maricaulaceae bacterium]
MAEAATIIPTIGAIIVLGVGAQWAAWRFQWPAIVLMSLAGLVVGPFAAVLLGAPLIDPRAAFGDFLRPMIAMAVGVILFDGGLALRLSDLKQAGAGIGRLVFVGAPLGWALGALAARYAAGLPWDLSLLLGGLLVVTGPTVIMPLLRQSKLSGRPAALLKWEGVVNDAVGALFAVAVFEIIQVRAAGDAWPAAALHLVFGALFAASLGVGAGWSVAQAFRRGLTPEYLKTPVLLALVLAVYALCDAVAHETGLVGVTVMGMTVANARLAAIAEMRRFKESIAIVLVSAVFVTLTAGLSPEVFRSFDARVFAFVAAMMFVARPATIWLATWGAGLDWRERALVGWIAPRGVVAAAVAGFFAAELSAAGRPDAERLTSLVFALVFATVLAHGFSIGPLARRLGLSQKGPEGVLIVGASDWSQGLAETLKSIGTPTILADANWTRLRAARLAGLNTFYGEVLSETAEHRLDHAQFGWVFATGPNDAYNALVSVAFGPELGRQRVFQLPDAEVSRSEDTHALNRTARGRTAIGPGWTYEALARAWWRGARFRATPITEEYPVEHAMAEAGPDRGFVLERTAQGRIRFLGAGAPPKGEPGSVLVSFGPPAESKS